MMMRSGRSSKCWIHVYTTGNCSTMWNGLGMMKTRLGTQCWTLLAHLTDSKHSMLTTWTDLDPCEDLRTGCEHGRMVKMMLMITWMMNMPKTEGSLGLRRGVMSQWCSDFCWLLNQMSCQLILFELFELFGLFALSFSFAWTKREYTKEPSALNLSFPSFPLYS